MKTYTWNVDEPNKLFTTELVRFWKEVYNEDTFSGDMRMRNIHPQGKEVEVKHIRSNGVVVGIGLDFDGVAYELLHTDSSSYEIYVEGVLVEKVALARG